MEVSNGFEQSDHAAVNVEINIIEDIEVGQGLTRVNSTVLSDPVNLLDVIMELGGMLEQIPLEWYPHQRLEYLKMSIRKTIADFVGRDRSELKRSIDEIEESLDAMHKLKSSACALRDDQEKNRKIHLINDAVARQGNDLTLLREKQSAKIGALTGSHFFKPAAHLLILYLMLSSSPKPIIRFLFKLKKAETPSH